MLMAFKKLIIRENVKKTKKVSKIFCQKEKCF